MQKQQSERLDAAEMIFQLRPAAVSEFVHYLRNPQTFFFSKTFIKNESYDTIHTFKNDFTTVFSVINNKQYPNLP